MGSSTATPGDPLAAIARRVQEACGAPAIDNAIDSVVIRAHLATGGDRAALRAVADAIRSDRRTLRALVASPDEPLARLTLDLVGLIGAHPQRRKARARVLELLLGDPETEGALVHKVAFKVDQWTAARVDRLAKRCGSPRCDVERLALRAGLSLMERGNTCAEQGDRFRQV